MKKPCVYILLCADKSFYVGCTTNLTQRIAQHETGPMPGYSKHRLPVRVVFTQEFNSTNEATEAEQRLKGWSRRKKQALIDGDYDLLHKLAECQNTSRCISRPKQLGK